MTFRETLDLLRVKEERETGHLLDNALPSKRYPIIQVLKF
jgi:hypothetical protein